MIVIMAPTVTAFPQLSALIHYEPIINSVNVGCNKHSDRNYHWIMIFIQVYLNRSGVINRRPCVGRLVLSFLQPLIGTKKRIIPVSFYMIVLWNETSKNLWTISRYVIQQYESVIFTVSQFSNALLMINTDLIHVSVKSRHRNLFHWK